MTELTSRVTVIPAHQAQAAQAAARKEFEAACARSEQLVGTEVLERWWPATKVTR